MLLFLQIERIKKNHKCLMQNKVFVRKGNSKNMRIPCISILSSFAIFSEHKEKEQTKKKGFNSFDSL